MTIPLFSFFKILVCGFGRIINFILQYALIVFSTLACFIIFRVLNKTEVIGQKHAKLKPGLVIISNHQSMIDSFMIGSVLFTRQILLKPWLLPWHMPDKKNFFALPYLRPLMKLWKTIPVSRNQMGERKDISAFRSALKVLEKDTLHVYIEGTRSPNNQLLSAKKEVGGLVLLSGTTVLPVYFTGMHQLQPYRKRPGDPPKTWLRFFGKHFEWLFDFRIGKKITLAVGQPMLPDEIKSLRKKGDIRHSAQYIADQIMNRLEGLKKLTNF